MGNVAYMDRILFDENFFELNLLDNSKSTSGRFRNLWFALVKVTIKGSYLEFGVFKGHTINFIAKRIGSNIIYGFDSWQGIPEEWFIKNSLSDPTKSITFPMGSWSAEKPKVYKNVKLVDGWFKDSLPVFIKETDINPIAFLHIDSDLYSSAKTIFNHIGNYIVSGTVIVFDEWHAHEHEKKAFSEWLQESDKTARIVVVTNTGQCTVIIN